MSFLFCSPSVILSVILTLAVIFVNGLTDAPNAVATCITTRCMSMKSAVFMSAILNFAGVSLMTIVNPSITETISNMVYFGDDEASASVALCAALFSIVLWAVLAWYFGIPTSESHALIAALTGSAVAINGSLKGINGGEWVKAIYGLFTSCLGGFLLGFIICKIVLVVFRNIERSKGNLFFKYAGIFGAGVMSFMHGAQDGQKFIGVLLLCTGAINKTAQISPFIILLCSVIMALGTLSGGKKIIKAVGMDMVKLEKYQGFSADLAAAISLLLSTVSGFPVSTTHAKTTAMMGSGAARNKRSINPSVIKDIAMTWVLTFPGCGVLGFVVTKIFLRIL